MNESAGVRKDCVREKNANPTMYPAARIANSHGLVRRRVMRTSPGSNPRLCERCPVWRVRFRKGEGSTLRAQTLSHFVRKAVKQLTYLRDLPSVSDHESKPKLCVVDGSLPVPSLLSNANRSEGGGSQSPSHCIQGVRRSPW